MDIKQPNLKWKTGATFGKNTPKYIIIHHALAKSCTIEDVHKWHLSNGWAGFGYHYYVNKRGEVFKGRNDVWNGAHCAEKGMNEQSIGICLEGCYEDYTNMTDKIVPEAQISALILLVKELTKKYTIPNTNVKKHSFYAPYKKCCGNYFPWDEFMKTLEEPTLEDAILFLSNRVGINYDLWLGNAKSKKIAFLDDCFEKIVKVWRGELNGK